MADQPIISHTCDHWGSSTKPCLVEPASQPQSRRRQVGVSHWTCKWEPCNQLRVQGPGSGCCQAKLGSVLSPGCGEGTRSVCCKCQARSPGRWCSVDPDSPKASGERILETGRPGLGWGGGAGCVTSLWTLSWGVNIIKLLVPMGLGSPGLWAAQLTSSPWWGWGEGGSLFQEGPEGPARLLGQSGIMLGGSRSKRPRRPRPRPEGSDGCRGGIWKESGFPFEKDPSGHRVKAGSSACWRSSAGRPPLPVLGALVNLAPEATAVSCKDSLVTFPLATQASKGPAPSAVKWSPLVLSPRGAGRGLTDTEQAVTSSLPALPWFPFQTSTPRPLPGGLVDPVDQGGFSARCSQGQSWPSLLVLTAGPHETCVPVMIRLSRPTGSYMQAPCPALTPHMSGLHTVGLSEHGSEEWRLPGLLQSFSICKGGGASWSRFPDLSPTPQVHNWCPSPLWSSGLLHKRASPCILFGVPPACVLRPASTAQQSFHPGVSCFHSS
ncbi:hypothetical protein Cadr_000017603 [Camelus dromedarius]|uniref:Uncharacterized protein n=1 Tax=Camelus dromedarius TaxID=9838 RepID=A0A5N4DHF6_CAMDR|nr:hypothetical protein Cadr_000017603 [Camelus dromedarius]